MRKLKITGHCEEINGKFFVESYEISHSSCLKRFVGKMITCEGTNSNGVFQAELIRILESENHD